MHSRTNTLTACLWPDYAVTHKVKISLLIDIQNNIKAQQSAGFTHWAKLNNLKQAAKTMNFLTEHGISSYGELESKLTAVSARRDTAHAEIKRIESRSAELALVMKHAGTYRQLKPLYERYRKSNDKEKFLRGHESEIILFEAAARELKRLGAVPLPTTESADEKDQVAGSCVGRGYRGGNIVEPLGSQPARIADAALRQHP